MKEKIGVGVITCNRPDFLRNCIKSIDKLWYDEFVIVNDGFQAIETSKYKVINNPQNLGVGKSKNIALKQLLNAGCVHIFIVEDDIIFKKNAFEAYITASKKTKVKHFNYCLHGGDNKYNGIPVPRKIIEIDGIRVSLYFNVYGACSYFHKSCLEDAGLIDENYVNAMEHVDHTMELIKKGYHPPFRWFIDLENSNDYIVDQDYNHNKSTIRQGNWVENFKKGVERFRQKHNIDVTNPAEIYAEFDEVKKYFKSL